MKDQNRKRVSGDAGPGKTAEAGARKRSGRTVVAPQTGRARKESSANVANLDQDGKQARFPIVGIGASAGGLEAFTLLLQHLPTDTGMAYVLVQHLDPAHESALTQLLARTTSMPVSEVTHGTTVVPDHVYVIPPNVCMEIVQGVLRLRPRSKSPGPHRSIDLFFESLAQDQKELAIGVVLSGSASDGTQGLEMIKAEGGLTYAQDDSSKYDSMPRSAVAAGCVDRVLSPGKIAEELARIAKHPFVVGGHLAEHPSEIPASPEHSETLEEEGNEAFPRVSDRESAYKNILFLLQKHRGVNFTHYRSNTIWRRITRRMVLNRNKSIPEYALFLQGNPKELDLLYADVLIHVTSFFRNPEAFEALKRNVLTELCRQRRQEDSVRVWTMGCSTGQEPYSIAMAFMEVCDQIPHPPKLQIFATDLNESLLEKARQGLYLPGLVADISPERLKRFFVEEPGGYRVCKSLRQLCVFARHDILRDPPFSRMDLISCRNVLIYLDLGSQKRILPNFHYALNPGGFLFLGASESIGQFTNLFMPADKRHKIFSKKVGAVPMYQLPVSKGQAVEKAGRSPRREAARDPAQVELSAQREADRMMVNRFAPPSVLINSELEVLQFRGPTRAFLEPPTGKASFEVLKMARAGLMLPLRAAIQEAKKKNCPVRRKKVRIEENGRAHLVNFEVVPLKNLKEPCYLILFEEASETGPERASIFEEPVALPREARTGGGLAARRIPGLERELADARDYAQSLQEQHETAKEELQASSEEAQSANEELQSINEELETSKEELESTNEELTTVNEELASRNSDLNRVNSDLNNLQASIKLPIVLLGSDLSIHHFSPQAQDQFNLVASDVGRPWSKVRHDLELPELEQIITDVITQVREYGSEVRDTRGHWHFLHVRPYLAWDKKVDGAVLVLVDINALKVSEQSVTAARDLAESILRTARDPFLILDAELRVEKANEAFFSTFRVCSEETIGRTIFELDHGHWNVPRLRELLEDILPRHSFFNNFEVMTRFQHIGQRTMLLNARRLSETAGQPARILLGIQDITELLQFQVQLRHSELRYRRLFEADREGVLILDPLSRKIIEANPSIKRVLGRSQETLIGKELSDIGLLKNEDASRVFFEDLHNEGIVRHEDVLIEIPGGGRRDLEFVSNLYEEGGGKVIQCNIRDVTARKKSEQELEEKARLLDLSNDAIVVRGLDDRISLWNQGAEKLFGWSATEAIGRHLHSLLLTEFPKPIEEILEELYREGLFSGEVIQIARDGRRVPSLCRWVLDRPTHSILTSHTDVTERNKMMGELRQANLLLGDRAGKLEQAVAERTAELAASNKQLEAFVYSIAHDLRAPLRAMQGFSEMLVEDAGDTLPAAARNHIERIKKSAVFMDAMLLDLLDFSRVSQQRLELKGINLETVVRSVLARLEKNLQERNAHVENSGPWGQVLAHEPTLAQVLFNLISNALKFVRPDVPPRLLLRTEENGAFLRVWVEDNGIGIEPEHQEQIFKLFTRLHVGRYSGTGIGLTIVQKGIERMGGQCGVDSVASQGSRFWFELRKAPKE